jgi:hypothetical protein
MVRHAKRLVLWIATDWGVDSDTIVWFNDDLTITSLRHLIASIHVSRPFVIGGI